MKVDGKVSRAIGVNGTVPAPLVRLKEGQRVRLRVQNTLDEESSIHWHGLLVPFEMDGVPGVSFPGIMPRSTFTYEFEVPQYGTYWYHSHSAYQEEDGLYGPIVIDPAGPDPVAYDREHVLVLSDHTPLSGATVYKKLKQMGGGRRSEPGLVYEIGEPVVCGQRHLVACLLQPPAQARERRDIASRTRCHDQNPHQVAPVVPQRRSWLVGVRQWQRWRVEAPRWSR